MTVVGTRKYSRLRTLYRISLVDKKRAWHRQSKWRQVAKAAECMPNIISEHECSVNRKKMKKLPIKSEVELSKKTWLASLDKARGAEQKAKAKVGIDFFYLGRFTLFENVVIFFHPGWCPVQSNRGLNGKH